VIIHFLYNETQNTRRNQATSMVDILWKKVRVQMCSHLVHKRTHSIYFRGWS